MPPRAIIIAIEKYPKSIGLANELPGTNNAGDEFYKWFVERKLKPLDPQVNPQDFVVGCVDHPYPWKTTGTSRPDVLAEIDNFVTRFQDDTPELYFFFSGHGFSYTDMGWTRAIDVLVTSEFRARNNSGGACIKLQEIQEKLWSAMGPGDHYYFIDACRNTTTHGEINVLDTGLTFTPSQLGKPYRYTLYSTVKGTAAEVESGFPTALVSGLKGSGRAKGWDDSNDNMFVKFDLLVDYVAAKLPSQLVDPYTDGNGEGLILQLVPIPESECRIQIENASDSDKFKLTAKTKFGEMPPQEFQGKSYTFKLRPFSYNLEVTHPTSLVVQVDPPPQKPLDLYDACEVKFELAANLIAAAPPAPSPSSSSTVEVVAAEFPEAEIEFTDVFAGGTLRGADLPLTRTAPTKRARRARDSKPKEVNLQGAVEPGTYMLKMRERGVVVGRRKVTVEPGKNIKIDLLERPPSKTREDILKAISLNPKAKVAEFSDLAPTANLDLSLWLSLFGAARILGPKIKKELSKFEGLELESFDDIKAGESCVYLLTAFEKSQGKFVAGLSKKGDVKVEPMKSVPNLTAVYQWRKQAEPGPHLLTVQLPEQVPTTFATYCLPNRVTFMVVAEDEKGRLDVRHYMLPVGKLIDQLDPQVRYQIELNPLNIVRYMSLVQSQFARKRSLEPAVNTDESRTWQELVYGKWIDPVMSLIAAYFFIRQGKASPKADGQDRWIMDTVIKNLRTYFGDLPDIAAIERAMGKRSALPKASPLILDGALLLEEDLSKVLPLPQSQLDYSGPWTSWRGAVKTS